MSELEWIDYFQAHPLFKDLSEEEQRSLLPFVSLKKFRKGEWIIQEGEPGSDLYIVRSGEAEILKEDPGLDRQVPLLLLKQGSWAGEMAWLEKKYTRSASIQAVKKTEMVVVKLQELGETFRAISDKLSYKLTAHLSRQLRKINEFYIDSLEEKIGLFKLQNTLSKTIIYLLLFLVPLLTVNKFLLSIEPTFTQLNFPIYYVLIGLLGIAALCFIKKSGHPFSFYGLSFKHGVRYALEGTIVTLPFLGMLIGIKWLLITQIKAFQNQPLFALNSQGEKKELFLFFFLMYILLIPFQELLLRGVLQTSFKNFFQGPNRVFLAILISNLFIEIISTLSSIWLALGLLGCGILWGYLYERQNSIVGSTISHMILGIAAFFILKFDAMISL